MTLGKRSLENIVGKGKNAGNLFCLFPQCFLFYRGLLSANAFNLDRAKILSFGKEVYCMLTH